MKKRCARCDRPVPLTAWRCEDCGGEAVLTPGSIVSGRWRIVRLVRAGSGSRVYVARGRDDRVEVVLKARPPRPLQAPEPQVVLDAFPITAVRHPNVVTALEGGVGADGSPWLALETLEGRTIREHLAQGESLPVAEVSDVLMRVAQGLGAIHEQGLIHGSLDSRGVFLAQGKSGRPLERVVILDFPPGGGRNLLGADGLATRGASGIHERPPDVRTDLFALGTLAWECLSGRSGGAAEGRRARRLPVPLTLLQPPIQVPPELDDFVMRLMARDPERRPSSALEAVERFARWRRGKRGSGAVARTEEPRGDAAGVPPSAIQVDLKEPAVAQRGNEMRHLARILDETAAGRGSVVWMEGDEGCGKSTLGRRFLALASDRGFRVGMGRTLPGHRLAAWIEALSAVGVTAGDDAVLTEPLEKALIRVARSGPVALLLEDVQHAEPFSVDLLERIALRLADEPARLLILAASRPLARSGVGDHAALHRALATIRGLGGYWQLPGMSDREIDAVTAGMSRKPFDPELRAMVRRAAAGNPMVAVQVLRHLASEGALTIADGRVALVPGRATAIPDGLRQVLVARLEGLRRSPDGDVATEVLDRVVLLGRHATITNLRTLLDLEGRSDLLDGLSAALARLEREGFVREVPWRPEPFLMPVHAGLREVLVAERGGPESGRRHLAAARVLESMAVNEVQQSASDLADHYERAGYLDVAIEWLRRAADRAVTEGDIHRVRELLRRAEGHLSRLGLPADPRRTAVLLDLAAWEVFGGEHEDAARALETVERECPPSPGSATYLRLLEVRARLEDARSRPERAGADLERLEAGALEAGQPALEAWARLRLACLLMDRGDNKGAEARVAQAAAGLLGLNDPRSLGELELVRGRLLRKTGSHQEALASLDRALSALTDPRDFAERVETLFHRAACLMDREEYEPASEVCRTGAFLCDQAGYPRGLAGHLTHLAICLGHLGRADEGMEVARRALEILERIGDSRGLAEVLTALADLALGRKDWPTVRGLSEKSLTLCRQTGYVQGERLGLLNLARALHGMGDYPEARRRLEACLLTARRDDALTVTLANAHLFLADLLDASGERDAAMRHRLGAVVVFEKLERPDRAAAVRREMGGADGPGAGPNGG